MPCRHPGRYRAIAPVTEDFIQPGAIVIDVGMNRLADGKPTGDVDPEAAQRIAGAYTPVPGGVDPLTIAMLMTNTVQSAERRLGAA
jgi:methylenetetrahydrofolate dehydrogenase (NADP+)/methenyltetrahydrofolate cyclohydrolase